MILLANVAGSSGAWAPGASRPSAWLGWSMLALAAALAALGLYAWLRRRAQRVPVAARPTAALPMTCPSCRRSYPLGTSFCPADASRLQPAQEGGAAGAARGGKCPRCRRAFEAGMRFCPMDAEELVPLTLWQASHAEGGVHVESYADHLIGGQGKICPVCAGKYDLEAVFCGRDASELVTVN
ncbi:MAG TPA: hypothetical protein VFF06_08445 [Polyangia bacterium]|nr:hypothetical protein [Polyangia bacterium]